jgi:ABC-2 type transport system permease protein
MDRMGPTRDRMGTFGAIRLVARRELLEQVRGRSFLISTGITLLILCGIIVVPRLFGVGEPATYDVGVVGAASAPVDRALAAQAKAAGVEVRLRRPADAAAAETAVRDGDLDLAIVDGRELVAKSDVDEQLNLLVQSAWRTLQAQRRLASAGLDPAEAQAVLAPAPLPVRSLEPVDEEERSKRTIATVSIFLLYGQLIGYCFAVAMGVVEEKSTRVVEVLLAAVRPVQLLAGKVIGLGLVGLIQLVAVGVVGLAVAIAVDAISLPAGVWGTVGWVLLWFLLGYAFYSSLFAVAGAIVSRQEELQNTATPLNLLMVGSFLVAFMGAGSNPSSTLATVTSYLPPVAPMVIPVRIAAGEAAAWQVAVSLGIMLASSVAVVVLAARLYEGAILRTGARVKLRDAWRGARRQPAASRA